MTDDCNKCDNGKAVAGWGVCPDCFGEDCERIIDDIFDLDDHD